MTPEEIARKLTPAQRDGVMGRARIVHVNTAVAADRLVLRLHGPCGGLTNEGLAVRAALEKMEAGDGGR